MTTPKSSGEPRHACTIVAGNYFAHARVLAKSFLEQHPGGRFTVLVLDEPPPSRPEDEFEVFRPSQFFEQRELLRMTALYGVMELATAVKPTFLRHLLATGSHAVLYLDPDIVVFRPLDDLFSAAHEAGIVLTPHLVEPHPRWDGLVPTEDIVMAAGVYNLGFVGVGAKATRFLDWWIACLARECVVDVQHSRFVDQRWMDLAPAYFGAHITRDPGLNVAWWNMPMRTVTGAEGDYMINGSPLKFMHFSGFDPAKPHVLSKHQGPKPRVLLSQRPDLAPLFASYAELLEAAGFEEASRRPYGFAVLPSGTPVAPRMRDAYRVALMEWERDRRGLEPPCPFDPDEEAAFLAGVARGGPHAAGRRHVHRVKSLWRDRRELPRKLRARAQRLREGLRAGGGR